MSVCKFNATTWLPMVVIKMAIKYRQESVDTFIVIFYNWWLIFYFSLLFAIFLISHINRIISNLCNIPYTHNMYIYHNADKYSLYSHCKCNNTKSTTPQNSQLVTLYNTLYFTRNLLPSKILLAFLRFFFLLF